MLYNPEWKAPITEVGPREILLEAANLLRKKGWCQWTLEDDQGRMCALGAILKANRNLSVHQVQKSLYLLGKFLPPDKRGYGPIVPWNNAPGRTKEEVIAAMEGAAHAVV